MISVESIQKSYSATMIGPLIYKLKEVE